MYNFETIFRDCKQRYKSFSKNIRKDREPRSFEKAINAKIKEGVNPVIAEVKPASPQGVLREIKDAGEVAKEMLLGGACGISVLTEEKYFKGSLKNLRDVSKLSTLPVLRKDFIFDEAQIREAYYYGADSLLLIAGLLEKEELASLAAAARKLGMEPVIEVHSCEDVEKAAEAGGRLILINNRDKDTLRIDLRRSRELGELIEKDKLKISASGISNPEELRYVLESCDAALIGTAIMKARSIREKVEEFVYA
jgi:indole-3-glycerol phosphate synthase